uniref:Uncharacterized protein n=1 Tax=Panagrolaimus sp. ES5 TaxID=591445 RepID=A0AC34EZQ0_9BILA
MLKKTVIKTDSGEEIPLERTIANIPNLTMLIYEPAENSKSISSKTAKELLRIPSFQSLEVLGLENVPEDFDIDTMFYEIIKKSGSKIQSWIIYDGPITSEHKKHLQEIADEILDEKIYKYVPPFIGFPGQTRAHVLYDLHRKSCSS